MNNHWTGGQYSLYRFFFGLYLCIHFVQLLPWTIELFSNEGMIPDAALSPLIRLFPNLLAFWDTKEVSVTMALIGVISSLFFMVGKWDKFAAGTLSYLLACFLGKNPLISNPSLPFVGFLLLAHLLLPKAPYGSLRAKHRMDPRGDWKMSSPIFLSAWCVMAISYSYSGILKLSSSSWVDGTTFAYLLQNPLVRCNALRDVLILLPPFFLKFMTWGALFLEVSFVLFALFKRLRPWAWLSMLLMHLGLLFLIDFADLTWGMIFLHFFTFNPGWIKPCKRALTVYYDGTCGFCHSFIRFILSENIHQNAFQFAPLQDHFPSSNTIVVKEGDKIYTKSKAVFHIFASLGGVWRIFSWIFVLLPHFICDLIYDFIARIRHSLFKKPKELCPLIPQDLRKYFDPMEE